MHYSVHGSLSGKILAPVSKSDLHRLIIAASLCFGEQTIIHRYTMNDDIRATASIMEAAGATIQFHQDSIEIHGMTDLRSAFHADCCESGSTLRFLLPVLSALGADCCFSGKGRLPQRPITPLMNEMKAHGANFSAELLPFHISGRLTSGVYTFPGNISSQYITGLLMALPLCDGDSKILLTSALESQAYVDMTLSVLRRFGITIHVENPQLYTIPGGQRYHSPAELSAEGDWSNAAFWLCAGAISGAVTVHGIQSNSLQGDKAVCDILAQMGAEVRYGTDSVSVHGRKLHGITIDGSQIPDIIPILSVVAACAEGTTHIINAGRLRIKESDRLSAVSNILQKLGASVEEEAEGLVIHGSTLIGGTVDSYNDHRIAMSAAIAALHCQEPVIIENPNCVKKSYPQFYEEFARLGGVVRGIQLG